MAFKGAQLDDLFGHAGFTMSDVSSGCRVGTIMNALRIQCQRLRGTAPDILPTAIY